MARMSGPMWRRGLGRRGLGEDSEDSARTRRGLGLRAVKVADTPQGSVSVKSVVKVQRSGIAL
eukprot:scaffold40891_cov97-Phaeocystis_antarctica.AAC.2